MRREGLPTLLRVWKAF